MPRMPEGLKRRILKSKSFKKWKKNRLRSKSPPKIKQKDLLRAYMIDKGIKATETDPKYWSKVPQRADIAIDRPRKKKGKYYRKE